MLVGLLIVLVGGAAIYRIAADHGHNGVVWSMASMVAAGAGSWVGWNATLASIDGTSASSSGTVVVIALTAGIPVLVMVVAGVLAIRIPPVSVMLSDSGTCSMQWVDGADVTNTRCSFVVAEAGLSIEGAGAVVIPYANLVSVERDGECLSVRWREVDGEAGRLLVPEGLRGRAMRIRAVERLAAAARPGMIATSPSGPGRGGRNVPTARVVNR